MRRPGAVGSWTLAAMITVSFVCPSAFGETASESRFLYQWTDEQGNAHITDSLANVPARYRSKVRTMKQHSAAEQEELPAVQPGMTGRDLEDNQRAEDVLKKEWQQRVLDAKQRMSDAEARYRDLEKQKKDLSEQYGGGVGMVTVQTPNGPIQVPSGSSGMPQEVLDEIKKIEQLMEQAGKDRDDARNDIQNVIPDEARRAGIPPGWLREVE